MEAEKTSKKVEVVVKSPKVKTIKRRKRKSKVMKAGTGTAKVKNVSDKILTSLSFLSDAEQAKVLGLAQKMINKKLKKIMQ